MSLIETFLAQTNARGGATAIMDGRGRSITFAMLAQRSAQLAARFRRAGINEGDRVLVARGMSIALYETLLAIWRLGAVAVFPEPAAGLAGVDHAMQAVRPKAIAAGGLIAAVARVHPAFGGAPLLPHQFDDGASFGDLTGASGPAPALITFTSGSTGAPKGIVRSIDFLLLQHRLLEKLRQTNADDIDLISLPVFVLSNLAQGAVSIFPDGKLTAPAKLDGDKLATQIRAHQINRIIAPPAIIRRIAEAARGQPLADVSAMFTGGGPVFPNLLKSMRGAAPRAAIHAVYGSTEAEPIAHIAFDSIAEQDWAAMAEGRGLLAGAPIPEISVRLRDSEIQVAGAHVNPGYLNPEHDMTTKLHEHGTIWHRTGDSGAFDAQNRLWLLGRRQAAAQGLYPFAIETAALSWPGVDGAALLARANGSSLLAVTGQGLDGDALSKRARNLGDIEIRPMKTIPMDKRHNSKIDYPALERLLS